MQQMKPGKRSVVVPFGVVAAGLATVALIWPNGDPDGGDGVTSGVGRGAPHIIEVIVRTDAGKAHVKGDAVSNVREQIYRDDVDVTTRNGELPYKARITVYDDESVAVQVEATLKHPSDVGLVQCEITVDGRRPNGGRAINQEVVPSNEIGSTRCHYNFVGMRLR